MSKTRIQENRSRMNRSDMYRAVASIVSVWFLVAITMAGTLAATTLPSRFVPGDAVAVPAAGDQQSPYVASGPGTVLVVWADERANSTLFHVGETSWDIYGMRFDGDGTPLDPMPFIVTSGPSSETKPKASWNGTHWLVVYPTTMIGTGSSQGGLEALRVAPDGTVVDTKPIQIFGVVPGLWDVASDGNNWVIASSSTPAGGNVGAIRISPAGVVLDPVGVQYLPPSYRVSSDFELEFAGGVFLIKYFESPSSSWPSVGIRFDSSLTQLDPAPNFPFPVLIRELASNGTGFYGVWSEQLPDFTYAIKGSRIDTDGQFLDGSGVIISGPGQATGLGSWALTWDGSYWRMTWAGNGSLRTARIDTAGNVLDPGGIPFSGPEGGPAASAGNGSIQIVWTDFQNNNYDVYSAHVDSSFDAGPNQTLSTGAPMQLTSDAAAGDSGWLLAYRSSAADVNRVHVQALDAAGNPLTAEPLALDVGDYLTGPGSPSVAWNGSLYLVTWGNSSGIVAQRFRADGTPVDSSPFVVLNPGFGRPAVEALGDDFLVVGRVCASTCQNIYPVAARVDGPTGIVLDSPSTGIPSVYASNVRVTTLGGKWLVVWQNNVSHDDCLADTNGVFIDANGVGQPVFPIYGWYSSCGGNGIPYLDVASSGSTALMVQSQEWTSGVELDLLGVRVTADGTTTPAVNLTPWSGNQYRPRLAWDGTQFVMVFQDQKAGFGLDVRSDLFGMRIAEDGTVIDSQGFLFSNSVEAEAYPIVAASNGTTLIAGALLRGTAPWLNYRLGYELFGADGNAWPVATANVTPAGGDVPFSVDFSSTGSFDPDGSLVSYQWDFGDGNGSTEPSPGHQYLIGGPFVATLAVTDDGGTTTNQEVRVGALEPNQPPIAVASANVLSGPAPLYVVFSTAGSYDPDGFPGNIKWTFGDGGIYWGATAYHTFSQAGSWPVDVTVYDARGGTGTASLTIDVGAPLIPNPPSDPRALVVSTSWINLYWSDNSNNETGFEVERCVGTAAVCAVNPSAWSQIGAPGVNTELFINNTDVQLSTTYCYRVRAVNITGPSAWSPVASATTPGNEPAAPTNLSAYVIRLGRGKNRQLAVDLSWTDNANNETGYVVERCTGAGCTDFSVFVSLGANTRKFRDAPVEKRVDYRYRVKATNNGADSPYSNEVQVRP